MKSLLAPSHVIHLPHFSPMLATLSQMPANSEDYGFEYKWDGYRALCYWDGRTIRFESRNQIEFGSVYPELLEMAKRLQKPVVLDGEIIALDQAGQPSFSTLQKRAELIDKSPVVYMIFDLLFLGSQSRVGLPYIERRRLLEQLHLEGPFWKTPPSYPGEGEALLNVARHHGYEGIMAKRLDSLYRPGDRTSQWLKIKLIRGQEFVIGGWLPGKGSFEGTLGSLLLGYFEGLGMQRVLRYAGNVGTGLSDKERKDLLGRLSKLRTSRSPFSEPVTRGAFYVRPELVAEIEFRGWTQGLRLRQGSFKGLRIDKNARSVVLERPTRSQL